MSLIFDRTERKNNVTRELYYSDVDTTQLQFLGDETVTVWDNGEIWLMNEIGGENNTGSYGWLYYRKYNVIYSDGRVKICL